MKRIGIFKKIGKKLVLLAVCDTEKEAKEFIAKQPLKPHGRGRHYHTPYITKTVIM